MTQSIGFTLALVAALAWSGWTFPVGDSRRSPHVRDKHKRWDRMPPISAA